MGMGNTYMELKGLLSMQRSFLDRAAMQVLSAVLWMLLVVVNPVGLPSASVAHAETEQTVNDTAQTLRVGEAPADEVSSLADIQEQILLLNRDLFLLEEDLLFPPNTQVVVFVSWQGQTFFNLDSIELKVDAEVVAAHLYTQRQKQALQGGGLQRLYLGNLKAGPHEVTAIVTGIGPENRAYRRAATLAVQKTEEPLRLALRIQDNGRTQQPEFTLTPWAAEE